LLLNYKHFGKYLKLIKTYQSRLLRIEFKGLIIYLNNAQPINQELRTKPKGFYANSEERPYMGTKLFA